MKCSLDENKAMELRAIINKDHYCYMYDLEKYYEICTIMDRLEDTVCLLNNFELPASKDQFNATDFISWVNYADLIINCVISLNNLFMKPNNITAFHDDNIKLLNKLKKPYSSKYLGQYYHNDNDDNFFKFIRSMVLAHSLKIDCNKFKNFTHKKYAYTPLVRWDSVKRNIEITYYIPDFKIKTQNLLIDVNDLFKYLESRYNYLDIIFPYIEIEKGKEKNEIKKKYCKAFQCLPTKLDEKINLLKKVYYENGDLDAKSNDNLLIGYINIVKSLLESHHSESNKEKLSLFKKIMNFCVDDIIEDLKQQDNRNWLISEVFQHYNYSSDNGKFVNAAYHINKIYEECEFFMESEAYFNTHYEKVKINVANYFEINEKMQNQEKVLLCICALGYDNLLYREGVLNKFPDNIIKEVRETYEI